ncbi:MAG: DUF928 domain-containing protein [Rhizobiales bacterium]|nr:DUF928 domain-containing protein [Hyphomicrobiales bacterium]
MTIDRHILIGGLAAVGMLIAVASLADDQGGDAQTSASEQDIAESLKRLVFVPHDSGAPEVTDTGGVRSITVLPKVELLAPESVALTLSSSPTLYWHISKAAPGPVHFTLLADDPAMADPLLDLDLDGIDREGIYAISLDDHGVALDDGQRYVWSVALSAAKDSHATDVAAQTVMLHSTAPDLAIALDRVRPDERAVRLAAEGYWYDAVETLSQQIETGDALLWQDARARLLDQAGLLQAARFDRQNLVK